MATHKSDIPLERAQWIAGQLVGLVEDACTRLEIVGSIRRERSVVHDIELCCEPRFRSIPSDDLFADTIVEENMLEARTWALLQDGMFIPDRWGMRLKRFLYQGVSCELFIMLPPSQWGMGMLIRTGPAEYSKALVTPYEQRGKWLPPGHRVHDLGLYGPGNVLIPTPEETDVYAALGIPYRKPQDRR